MFQASVDGELYDPAKWSDHYRPYGVSASSKTETVQVAQVAQTETVAVTASDTTETVTETVSEETSGNNKSADEILAMIRDRKKNVTESA
jgi:hypothetical protein